MASIATVLARRAVRGRSPLFVFEPWSAVSAQPLVSVTAAAIDPEPIAIVDAADLADRPRRALATLIEGNAPDADRSNRAAGRQPTCSARAGGVIQACHSGVRETLP